MSKLSINLADLRPADPRRGRQEEASSGAENLPQASFAGGGEQAAAALRREVEAIRAQLEYERQAARTERVRLQSRQRDAGQEHQQALADEREHVATLKKQLAEMVAALQSQRNAIEVERKALIDTRQAVEEDRRRLQEESRRLGELSSQVQADRDSLDAALAQAAQQRRQLDEAAQDLKSRFERLSEQSSRIDANRDEFAARQQALTDEREALRRQREQLDAEQSHFALQAESLKARRDELDNLAAQLAERQSDVGRRQAEIQDLTDQQQAELQRVKTTADSARRAALLADDAFEALVDDEATSPAADESDSEVCVSSAADGDVRHLLTDLPLSERSRGRASESRKHMQVPLATLVALLLVGGIVMLAVAPHWLGLGGLEPPTEPTPESETARRARPAVAHAGAYAGGRSDGLTGDQSANGEQVADHAETGGNQPIDQHATTPPNDSAAGHDEVKDRPLDHQAIAADATPAIPAIPADPVSADSTPQVVVDEPELMPEPVSEPAPEPAPEPKPEPAVPGGIWPYKAPEQLIAGSPSEKLQPTLKWVQVELAATFDQVRTLFRLDASGGPRQAIAIAFSPALQRDIDRYLPPPLELDRSSDGKPQLPSALLFTEFTTPVGRYLLVSQIMAQDGGKVELKPGRPHGVVLIPGAIQEETVVLDATRRAWTQPLH